MAHRSHNDRARLARRLSASGIGLALSFVAVVIGILMLAVFYPGKESRLISLKTAEPTVKSVKTLAMPPTSRGSSSRTTEVH